MTTTRWVSTQFGQQVKRVSRTSLVGCRICTAVGATIVNGGIEYDGQELSPLDTDAVGSCPASSNRNRRRGSVDAIAAAGPEITADGGEAG